MNSFFLKQSLQFYQSFLFYGKNLNPPSFAKIPKKLKSLLYNGGEKGDGGRRGMGGEKGDGGGGSNYETGFKSCWKWIE